MAEEYANEVMRIAVAQLCQNVGFQTASSQALEILQDLQTRTINFLCRDLKEKCNQSGRTEIMFEDVGLAFEERNLSIKELSDYIHQCAPVPFPHKIPKFPVRLPSPQRLCEKVSEEELASRPSHIPPHLPPLQKGPTQSERDTVATGEPGKIRNKRQSSMGSDRRRSTYVGASHSGVAEFDNVDALSLNLVKLEDEAPPPVRNKPITITIPNPTPAPVVPLSPFDFIEDPVEERKDTYPSKVFKPPPDPPIVVSFKKSSSAPKVAPISVKPIYSGTTGPKSPELIQIIPQTKKDEIKQVPKIVEPEIKPAPGPTLKHVTKESPKKKKVKDIPPLPRRGKKKGTGPLPRLFAPEPGARLSHNKNAPTVPPPVPARIPSPAPPEKPKSPEKPKPQPSKQHPVPTNDMLKKRLKGRPPGRKNQKGKAKTPVKSKENPVFTIPTPVTKVTPAPKPSVTPPPKPVPSTEPKQISPVVEAQKPKEDVEEVKTLKDVKEELKAKAGMGQSSKKATEQASKPEIEPKPVDRPESKNSRRSESPTGSLPSSRSPSPLKESVPAPAPPVPEPEKKVPPLILSPRRKPPPSPSPSPSPPPQPSPTPPAKISPPSPVKEPSPEIEETHESPPPTPEKSVEKLKPITLKLSNVRKQPVVDEKTSPVSKGKEKAPISSSSIKRKSHGGLKIKLKNWKDSSSRPSMSGASPLSSKGKPKKAKSPRKEGKKRKREEDSSENPSKTIKLGSPRKQKDSENPKKQKDSENPKKQKDPENPKKHKDTENPKRKVEEVEKEPERKRLILKLPLPPPPAAAEIDTPTPTSEDPTPPKVTPLRLSLKGMVPFPKEDPIESAESITDTSADVDTTKESWPSPEKTPPPKSPSLHSKSPVLISHHNIGADSPPLRTPSPRSLTPSSPLQVDVSDIMESGIKTPTIQSPAVSVASSSAKSPAVPSKKKPGPKRKLKEKTPNPTPKAVEPKPAESKPIQNQTDSVWVCPTCGVAYTEGEDMIACDHCDNWFHWACVGLIEAPPPDQKWFCGECIRTKRHLQGSTKKKGPPLVKKRRKKSTVSSK